MFLFGPSASEIIEAGERASLNLAAQHLALLEELCAKGLVSEEAVMARVPLCLSRLDQFVQKAKEEAEKEALEDCRRRYPGAAKVFEAMIKHAKNGDAA